MTQFDHCIIAYVLSMVTWHLFLGRYLRIENEVKFWEERIKKFFNIK